MIKGIGIDIVEIRRLERNIKRFGDNFLKKVFTDNEIIECKNRFDAASRFAGRWAVKEAFYKALPLECQKFSLWKSIEILKIDKTNKPVVEVLDEKLKKKLRAHKIRISHCSISHEQNYCVAIAVLE